jgi:RHS repeat-associated protein
LSQPGNVVWPLADNLGTVRDLAVYNAATGQTSAANHRVYDSFGNLKSQTNAAVDCLFGFTGRPLDPAGTGLQNNGNRWYDAATGGWLGADPTGLSAGDTNLYRYCGNSPVAQTDPTGQSTIGWIMLISGLPIIPYSGGLAGAAGLTSLASMGARWASGGAAFSTPLWAPTFNNLSAVTTNVGAFVGRWTPPIGAAMIAAEHLESAADGGGPPFGGGMSGGGGAGGSW